jgi:hypothetical protein
MIHHFSIDPRSVLGVSDNASTDEIHHAFREKSKKHHPDSGGDEWAFRMVVRAYEILKTTREIEERQPSATSRTETSNCAASWRNAQADRAGPVFSESANFDPSVAAHNRMAGARGPAYGSSFAEGSPSDKFSPTLAEFRTIDVELVWIRFELSGGLKERLYEEPAATTLSVCMVLSWPRSSLIKHAPEFPDAAEKLRVVIEAFEDLRSGEQVLGSRSRIEDGQFVGWLSYANVVQAEAGFQLLRRSLSPHGFQVSLRTRDEPLPNDWINR